MCLRELMGDFRAKMGEIFEFWTFHAKTQRGKDARGGCSAAGKWGISRKGAEAQRQTLIQFVILICDEHYYSFPGVV